MLLDYLLPEGRHGLVVKVSDPWSKQ
jgi:hypothetical protein